MTKTKRPRILVQVDLQGVEISLKVEWVFICIFSTEKHGIDRNEWWKVIKLSALSSLTVLDRVWVEGVGFDALDLPIKQTDDAVCAFSRLGVVSNDYKGLFIPRI